MKKIISIVCAGIIGLTTLSSCEEKKDPIDVTKNAFLVERAWGLKAIQFTSNVDAEFPVWVSKLEDLEPCQRDDYFYFSTKSTGVKADYFVKCNVSDPDFIDFFFTVTDNDNYITVYTNPDDMSGSVLMSGKMETPNINEFKIVHKYYNESTELNEQFEYVYEEIFPTDI